MVSSAFDPATNPMQIIFLGDALAPIIPDQITCKMFVKRWHFYNLSNFVWTIVFARIDTDARWEREGGRGSAWRHRRVSMQKRSRRRGLRAEPRMKSPTRRTSRTNRTLTILTMLNGKQAGPTQRQSPDTSTLRPEPGRVQEPLHKAVYQTAISSKSSVQTKAHLFFHFF